MRIVIAAAVLLAGAVVAGLAPVSAQNAPSYRYCLLDGSHPNTAGMVLCRFDTLAQCMASRNSLNDTCYINPQFPAARK